MNKKEKSKIVGLRLPKELHEKAKEMATNRGDKLANLIKKALDFIINNPKELADFETKRKNTRDSILSNPLESFRKIKKFGFSGQEDLEWITELMQSAWSLCIKSPANAVWVANTVKIFRMIIDLMNNNIKDKKKKEMMLRYSVSTFPETMGDLNLSIEKSLKYLSERTVVSGSYADYVARCLYDILREIDFEIKPNELLAIYNEMKPWAFLVATRGLNNYYGDKIDTHSLSENSYYIRKHKNGIFLPINNGNVSIGVVLAQFDNNGKRHGGFSAAISFKANNIALTLNPKSLYELYQAIELLESEKPEFLKGDMDYGESGEWTLYKWNENNPCIIMRPGISVNLSKEDFDNFINSVKELYDDDDVKSDLLHEYFEVYGAV